MPVDRLDSRLDTAWSHRLALVVAPAGSGKTTLLARFALRAAGPVGWYRAETWDRDEAALLAHLEAAVAPALDGVERNWRTVGDAANALGVWKGERALLVIDDLHTLHGTPAEAALERLIDYAPPNLTFAVASRVLPGFNLSRMRVADALVEIGGDDLRFRSWEVERLFHDFYGEPLPPEELARLARRTEGWAAGLQLFHLATSGRTPDERRRILGELGTSARFTRDYLTRNVVHQLPDELRRFLVDTSVLGRLSGRLCDQLLNRKGSAEILADLENRQLFTQPLPEMGEYRYHEVMRSFLQAVLIEELGEREAHRRFREAGALLASSGAIAEAFDAYCRAEDWDSARELLTDQGAQLADAALPSIDSIPAAVIHDPWLLLASARRLRAEGRFAEAVSRYQRAEAAFGATDGARVCRDERAQLSYWLDADLPARPDAFSLVRSATRREPLAVLRHVSDLPAPTASVVAGLAKLLAGNVAAARADLIHAAEDQHASQGMQIVASLAAGVAGMLMGQRHATIEVEGAVATAESSGLEWLARVGRASLALTGAAESIREADAVATGSESVGDTWGAALARLFAAWGRLVARTDVPESDDLLVEMRVLDAPVLEAWASGIVALAQVRAGEPDSRGSVDASEAFARLVGVDGVRMLAYLALAEETMDELEAEQYSSTARSIATETGLLVSADWLTRPAATVLSAAPDPLPSAPVSIRVLGAFELKLDGLAVDLSAIRPRARALLRLLALNAGVRLHHESIETALWPDADPVAAARNLHVAMAAVRRVLEPAAGRGSFQLLRRDDDAYVLDVPPGGEVDIVDFERLIHSGTVARERGDMPGALRAFQAALALYRGDVLPEDGPAEWVAGRREACRIHAVEATQSLAEMLLAQGDASGAAQACTVGLRIERYHDPLWRLLIDARDLAGDQGAATVARHGYDRMLAELGVASPTGGTPQF